MANLKYCQLMAAYNQWMNEKIYAACTEISDEDRKKDRGAFFKSIHGTLNHLLWADRIWMGRFTGIQYPVWQQRDELYGDFHDLRNERRMMDKEILQWADSVTDEWLQEILTFRSMTYQKLFHLPALIAVMQMFNHQTHHRGQLTTLLTQLGAEYGPTDLSIMPGLEKFQERTTDE